jgi:hypothetical protein
LRLEAALREAGQWELLLSTLERRAQRTTDSKALRNIQSARAQALVSVGRLDEAFELCLSVLAQDPTDRALLGQAEELAVRCNRTPAFEARLNELAAANHELHPDLACDLWLRLGSSLERAGDLAGAARLFERAQETGQRPNDVFLALSRIHGATGDVPALVTALRAFVDSSDPLIDPNEQINATFRLAELELLDKKRRKEGLERLEAALERAPDYQRAAHALLAAIEAGEPTKGLLKSFEGVARKLGDQRLLLRCLGFWVRRNDTSLAQLREAVDLAEQLGDQNETLALLERTVQFAREAGTVEEAQWALTRLADKREQVADFAGAVDLLALAIEHTGARDRFELELRLALLARDGKQDLALAARVLEKLATEEPSDARVWKPLLEIHRATGDDKALEACLSRAEEHVVRDDERRSLQLERVRLLIDANRLDEAMTSLHEAIESAPDNDEACDLLLSLLERQGKSQEVKDLLGTRLEAAIDRGDEARITNYAVRLGRLLEPEDIEGAIEVYRKARSAARKSRELLEALLRLTPESDSQDRADLMESLLPSAPSGEVEALALDLARLRLSTADETGIERAFELGFKLNPRSVTLRERLESWYRERDDWLPLAELLALDASSRERPEEAIAQYVEAAAIQESRLGDAGAAADLLGRALELDPVSPALLETLCQYLLTSAQGDRAVAVLTQVLAHPALTDEIRPLVLHLRAAVRARMDENDLAGLTAAVADLDAAALAGGADLQSDLIEILLKTRDVAEAQGNKDVERTVVLRAATMLPVLGRAREALDVLDSYTGRYDRDVDALLSLAALALAQGDWQRSRDAHLRLFELLEGAARIDAGLRFAEACEHCGSPMDARGVLEQMYTEQRSNAEVSRRLFRMYEAAGAHADLAELLLAEAEGVSDTERRYSLLTDAAELLLKSEVQQDRAVEALELALELVPGDHRATVAISKAYGLSGRIAEACGILEEAIKSHGKRRSRELSELQHSMSVVAGAAGDEEGRFAWLEAALQSDRKNGEVAAELAIAAQDRGLLDDAIKALQLITLLKEDCPMSRAEAYYRQAVIAEQRDDKKKAVLLAKRALGSDAEYKPAKDLLAQMGEA